jgi:hypothetical protein
MKTGRYDGANRGDYFQGLALAVALEAAVHPRLPNLLRGEPAGFTSCQVPMPISSRVGLCGRERSRAVS